MLLSRLKQLVSKKDGNVGTLFALLALPVAIVMGGSVDILRVANSKGKLQSAVESGVLSAASLSNNMTPEEAVNNYIEANLGSDSTILNLQVNIEEQQLFLNQKLVRVRATAEVPMPFLQMIGVPTLELDVSAEAVESQEVLEVAMVLDVSSSMRGNRLVNLKSAASDFVDQMLSPSQVDRTSISLVPFGGVVNIGELYNNYIVDDASAMFNPNATQYTQYSNVPGGAFKFTNAAGSEGKCVELLQEDFDAQDIPANSRPQVPYFWKYVNFNPWCPDENAASIWNTNNATALKERINNFSLSDGTGMDHGVAWGAKALSPDLKGKLGGDFPDRPHAYSGTDSARKIMVLMTDGGITGQYRPKDPNMLSTHIDQWAWGWRRNRNQQTVYGGGGTGNPAGHNSGTGRFKQVCDELKDNGVIIYTIGFQIRANSKPEHLMEYCASNPANYYLVESLDVGQAFNAIAASINKLRISG